MKRVNFFYLMVRVCMWIGTPLIIIGSIFNLTIMYAGILVMWNTFLWLGLAWNERLKIMNRKLEDPRRDYYI